MAWSFSGIPDPLGKKVFAGTEAEMEALPSYHEALRKVGEISRLPKQVPNAQQETANDVLPEHTGEGANAEAPPRQRGRGRGR